MKTKAIKMAEKVALELYQTANDQLKSVLEKGFGKAFFTPKPSKNIMDIVKTWKDVLTVLKLKEADVIPFPKPKNKKQRSLNAFSKIQEITRALNQDWTPDFNNSNQAKYYPYFEKTNDGGWVFNFYVYYDRIASLGSGCFLKSSELATYAGKQFLDIYKEYLPE